MAEKNTPKSIKPDTFVYRLCVSVCKWFIVSLLTYLCSIPVFTIGTAASAAISVFRDDSPEIRDIFGVYFSNFKAFFRKTVPVFLLSLPVFLLLFFNLSFCRQYVEPGTFGRYVVTIVIILLILTAVFILRFYHYEVTNREDLPLKARFLKAVDRMVRCLPVAGLLALPDIGLTATAAGAPVILPLLLIRPGLQAFLTCVLISWFENRGRKRE